jgi:tetratricopeptide (TPR) repeat protein/tRNA A-37 threonylcarbamoyl transferase component Bud32
MVCPTCGKGAGLSGDSCPFCQTVFGASPSSVVGVLTPPGGMDADTMAPGPSATLDVAAAFTAAEFTAETFQVDTTGIPRGAARGRPTGREDGGPLALGQSFGPRYHIIRLLGIGGMGAVYQAWDSVLGVTVALKVIRPEATPDAYKAVDLERRFKNELLLARKVTHKNVVRIHDLGDIDGIQYISMPFVEGADLATLIRREGTLPLPRSLRIARQIVAGLEAAHEAAVVHRDLKPANIMVGADDSALIMDFGIARSTARPEHRGAGVVGTLEYMAPEQASAGAVDQRADIYAVGLIFYEMLMGRRTPSGTNSAVEDMKVRVERGLPTLRSINPDIPETISQIVEKCLEIDPAKRYQTSTDLGAALNRLDDNGVVVPELRRLTPRLLTAAAVLVSLMLGGTYFVGRRTAPTLPQQHEPVPLLIADFDNRSGDPVFEGSVEQTLAIALEGAPYITVYRTRDARALAKQLAPDTNGRITEEVGQLIARREGLKVLLAGSVDTQQAGYRLNLRATDPATNQAIATVSRIVRDKEQVLTTLASMAIRVREALGESKTEMEKLAAAETVTAGSLDSMRAYARAQELAMGNRIPEALLEYQRAVDLDPRFGRAYSGMAVLYANTKQREKAEANYQAAMKNLDRMTEREKYRTLGTYYLNVAQNYEKAIENYETLVKLYPADDGGHGNLALAYLKSGNLARAVPEVRKSLEIYPKNLIQGYNYAMYSMYAGDFSTAVAEATRLQKEDPQFEYYFWPFALSKLAEGDITAARDAYDRLSQVSPLGSSFAKLGEADLALYLGRKRDAVRVLREGIAADMKAKNSAEMARKYVALAEALLGLGQRGPAAAAADEAIKASRSESTLFPAARVFLQTGREEKALQIAADLDKLLQRQTTAYALLIMGEVALTRGRLTEAIEAFRDAQKRHDSWFSRYLLGTAYVGAGVTHAAEALSELDACIKRRGEATDAFVDDLPTLRYLPPAYYWLARAQEDAGSTTEARATYDTFLKLRADADPADPLVADAARRLRQLG